MTRVLTKKPEDDFEIAPERRKVIDFRLEWLRAAGYTKRNAELIASDLSIDWHFACDLRQRCVDESLCMRIIYGP